MARNSKLIEDAPSVSEAIEATKATGARGLRLVSDNLPRIADKADKARHDVTDFVVTTSRSLIDQLRDQQSPVSQIGAAVGTSWLVKRVGRFAARNPGLLIGGAALAALGAAAWYLASQPRDTEAQTA